MANKGYYIVYDLLSACSIAIESDIIWAAGIIGVELYLFVENGDETFRGSTISPCSRSWKINE